MSITVVVAIKVTMLIKKMKVTKTVHAISTEIAVVVMVRQSVTVVMPKVTNF